MSFTAKKIQRPSVADTVFEDLRKRIIEGEWSEGERLPSENDIAAAYGVSRVSVRSALQKLIALNLLENRQGEGTFVKRFRFMDFMDNVSEILATDVTFEEVSDYRMKLEEISIRETCARHLPEQDFDNLRSFLDEMAIAVHNRDLQAFLISDYRFHRELCYLSGNKMWAYSYTLMISVKRNYWTEQVSMENMLKKGKHLDEYWNNALDRHRQIFEDVLNNDPDDAIATIRTFIY